jgi:hypothetical protein
MPNPSVNTDLAQKAREAGYLKHWGVHNQGGFPL